MALRLKRYSYILIRVIDIGVICINPKLVTFGIGLAVTFVVGAAMGMLDHNQGFAVASEGGKAPHKND